MFVIILRWKEASGNRDSDNIVESMRSGRNSKAANSEKSCEINACDRPEKKLC